MKSLQHFKHAPLAEEKTDYSKFDVLIRAGLANKAQMQRIHNILDKMKDDNPQFAPADRAIIQNLFTKMVDLISNNKQILQQARRVVKEEEQLDEGVVDSSAFKLSPTGRKVKAHRIVFSKSSGEDQEDQEDIKKEEYQVVEEASQMDTPFVLVLKRKALRIYPNGIKIALYYNDKLNKYFSVPYSAERGIDGPIQAEEVEVTATGIEQILYIKENLESGVITHNDDTESEIDNLTASAIVDIYNSLNEQNQIKLDEMLSTSHDSYLKAAQFAYSKSK